MNVYELLTAFKLVFRKGKPGYESVERVMYGESNGGNDEIGCAWSEHLSLIEVFFNYPVILRKYTSPQLPIVPLRDHLGRVINRDFYPCNFDKSPQVLQFNLNSLYLNSHPSWPVRTHQFHSSKPAPGFEIPPTKGDAQLELAVGFTQLLADRPVELQALVRPN